MADEIEGFSLCPRWFEIAATLKKCFLSKLSTKMDLWNSIANISTACGADFVKNLLRSKYLINSDDVKAIVPPTDIDFNGISLTIGIGNDTSVERRLKKTYPNIRFFGADPIYEAGKVFRNIGEYKQLGVSEKGGTFNASVLEGNKYVWRTIETVTVESLLRAFGIAHVDFLFLDIEGAEYSVLPVLSTQTSELNETFCQINVEIHGPLVDYGMTSGAFARLLNSVMSRESPYVPLWIPQPTMHHRLFLVNWKNLRCVKNFFAHWC
uniref:Methyltransferase FkbM domain-containing protein n=1 Tax=Ascaris suum TaxID=6253 RepID=F1LBN7_ASCSU